MRANQVFTPNDYPTYTYVSRNEDRLESRLRDALDTPGEIVSVSGPSKSGKTVLVEKIAGRENLITVTGAGVTSTGELWSKVLNKLEVPTSETETDTDSTGDGTQVGGKGTVKVPLIAELGADARYTTNNSTSRTKSKTHNRGGLDQITSALANTEKVLFIDDFHYMDSDMQKRTAREIKEAARNGVKICTASVPHRSDDVVRSNPELRGRVRAVDTKPWSKKDLLQIAEIGFPKIGVILKSEIIQKIAEEASQSPQLMQAICLQLCYTKSIRDGVESRKSRVEVTEDELKQIFEETATKTDFASLLKIQHAGPKVRGTERKEFNLSDGSRGDVYRALLIAIKQDPPLLSLPWNEISKRVQRVCSPDTPQAASLSTACLQISKMAKDLFPEQRIIDWEGEPTSILSIEDPYYLFYLRWSEKLKDIATPL
ncbi:hypothetical protein CLV01_3188 [Delftia sp. 60]|uniref:hypothetical protein n=1 Tax=Delftia sp. 60 TaxID=2035216 RepID=UPI000C4852D0|nr:hypothetical protein [Delftia sp. 60]PIF38027.1 hypothetical protein CLU98_3262 [Burkholderiales bacterium 23]PIF66792.1 hypothetical protein CLV01_3188 [Delftia sp. 60]